ncbi:MAG: hypothetical protein KDJ19_06495 [Hyphomicrobiaceae bacterium]|nr:hypothetical protein [Hyphomicrobiaceae bacterium]MCC0024751.1 hypothetical protein [Hyphomicrobiaceae bacterium]
MEFAANLVLALHLFSLAMGTGSGIANSAIGPLYGPSSAEQRNVLFKLAAVLGRNGQIAIGLLWITGIALIFMKGYNLMEMPVMFWIKILFVIILSGASGMASAAARRFANGDMAASTRAAMFGMVAGVSSVVVILCAVFAFE